MITAKKTPKEDPSNPDIDDQTQSTDELSLPVKEYRVRFGYTLNKIPQSLATMIFIGGFPDPIDIPKIVPLKAGQYEITAVLNYQGRELVDKMTLVVGDSMDLKQFFDFTTGD